MPASQTIILTTNSAMGPPKSESAGKTLLITPMYAEFGATRANFVTTRSRNYKSKIRNLENRNRREKFNVFMKGPTVLHLGIIIPSLIRILQASFDMIGFRAFLYASGATCLKFGLLYGGAASSFIPIFSVYIICLDKLFIFFGRSFSNNKTILFGYKTWSHKNL